MERVHMVEQQKYFSTKFAQDKKQIFHKNRNTKKRVLQGGFAEFEGILWTSLFFFLLVSFIGLLDNIEINTQSQLKEFQSEWNKIEE
jgi:hypothetical protein